MLSRSFVRYIAAVRQRVPQDDGADVSLVLRPTSTSTWFNTLPLDYPTQSVALPLLTDPRLSHSVTSIDTRSPAPHLSPEDVCLQTYLPRDAMHKRGLCRHAVSVCLSVCHVRGSCENE